MKIPTLTALCCSVVVIGLATLAHANQCGLEDVMKEFQWDKLEGNNGNHYGWYKEHGQTGQYTTISQLTFAQNSTSVPNTSILTTSLLTTGLLTTSDPIPSIPEPTSLMLLGVGFAGLGIGRRVFGKGSLSRAPHL